MKTIIIGIIALIGIAYFLDVSKPNQTSSANKSITDEEIKQQEQAKLISMVNLMLNGNADIASRIQARESLEVMNWYGKDYQESIRKFEAQQRKFGVSIGMTTKHVLSSSWGKPTKVNRSTYSFGVHEQWVYGNGNYLYFKDGILTAIQN
jgi:hypothetical protein